MADATEIVETLIDEQGTLYSEAMGAEIARDTPVELFHWLVGTTLLSARINASQAVTAARALRDHDLHTVGGLLDVAEGRLIEVLRENGYRRYDTTTAGYLRETAQMVRDDYGGDLREMRAADADTVLERIKAAKGVGDVGADIFAREVQLVWDVFYPRADGPAMEAARQLGLPTEAGDLADLAGDRTRFVRLMAALTRADLDGPAEAVDDVADL